MEARAQGCHRPRSLYLLLVVLVFPSGAAAQAVRGTILGTVRDATGGTIPGTTVTLTESSTGLARAVDTDQNGNYAASGVRQPFQQYWSANAGVISSLLPFTPMRQLQLALKVRF